MINDEIVKIIDNLSINAMRALLISIYLEDFNSGFNIVTKNPFEWSKNRKNQFKYNLRSRGFVDKFNNLNSIEEFKNILENKLR